MKKRLLSLFLCISMLAAVCTVFTGCGGSGNVSEEGVVKPMTITLTMVTNKETTESGIKLVQDAMNKIFENDLNTHVILQLYTEDEYRDAVNKKLSARAADEENGIKKSSVGTADDIYINELGREITLYPDAYENQIDIFMVSDFEEMVTYFRNDMLSDITEALSTGAGSLIGKYESSELLNFGKIGGVQYGVPGNGLYGDYQYMLVNKELLAKYHYSKDDITDINSIKDFLVDVAKNENGVLPLYNVTDMGLESLTGRPSVVASYIAQGAPYITADISYTPGNILMNEQVRTTLTTINAFSAINGDYPEYTYDVDFSKKFAAAYVSGDSTTPELYEDDYYVVMQKGPVAETAEVYSSMFVVSAYTSDSDRCMEVINLINTNSKIRNMLAYGVENKTYTVDEDTGIVTRTLKPADGSNNVYSMDIYKTGNLFLVKQNSEMTAEELRYSANDWALAKVSARDAQMSPNVGVSLKYDTVESLNPDGTSILLSESIEQFEMLYEELWTKMREFPYYTDTASGETGNFTAFLTSLERWIANNPYVMNATTAKATVPFGISNQYRAWSKLYLAPEGTEEA